MKRINDHLTSQVRIMRSMLVGIFCPILLALALESRPLEVEEEDCMGGMYHFWKVIGKKRI